MEHTMTFRQQFLLCILLLVTVMCSTTAQFLQLVYIGRSGHQPGNDRIFLECRRNNIAVHNPQIFVERSDLPRQPVRIVDNQINGQVTIVITQDLEGLYSCSDNGDRSTNTLALVAYPQADLSTPSFHAIQAGLVATIGCHVIPGKLSQYYSVTWRNGSLTIATFDPRTSSRSVLPGYQLHDNFSLIIYDVQPSDSSASYQCSVTIDDPQITGTNNVVYDQLVRITVVVYDPPSIENPPERRIVTVVGGSQPNTIFICEATRISACTTQISWIHNGRNTSRRIDQRFRADITGTSGRTISSRLNATQLRGSDSGKIDCVAHCMVEIPGEEPLVLSTYRSTTLSVLTSEFETFVSVTADRDLHIEVNFQDGYRILDQARLQMRYRDEMSTRSKNMTSEQEFMNVSTIHIEVPHSRLPYQHFRVDIALQVGGEVGPFVSEGRIHDITEHRQLAIIVGSSGGGVVLIAFLLMFFCWMRYKQKEVKRMKEIIVAAITEGKSPAEAKDYADILKGNVNKQRRKKQQRKKRVVPDEADEEKEMQKILSQFFKEVRKLPVS